MWNVMNALFDEGKWQNFQPALEYLLWVFSVALTLPTMGLLEQPQILGGGAISYACSMCAILMKLSEIKQLDK